MSKYKITGITERERERERQTDRQTDRQTETERESPPKILDFGGNSHRFH